jgi:hypothetical protein
MIIAYFANGKEAGRYDSPSDLFADYPKAMKKNGRWIVD